MTNKDKQKLQKKQKLKKRLIKVINIFCYIMTSIFILTLLLSLIPSNKSDDHKLNIDENGNIQLVNKQNLNNPDYYLFGGDIAYQLNSDFPYQQQLVDEIINKHISFYWFRDTETNNALWVQSIIRVPTLQESIYFIHNVYDNETQTYEQTYQIMPIQQIFSLEGLILFDSKVDYNENFKKVFKGMYRIFNFDKSVKTISDDYYNMPLEYGLNGIFNLNSTFNDKSYLLNGVLHYNTTDSFDSVPFASFTISYENGITFNTDNGIFTLYASYTYDDYKVFKLTYVNTSRLVYISNIVLTYQTYNAFNELFIDTSIKTMYSYKLNELYLPQRTSVSGQDAYYFFTFDFTSNFTSFNVFEVDYNFSSNPVYFEYLIRFNNTNNPSWLTVLDTLGQPIVDGDIGIGSGSGIDYNTSIFLSEYNNFVIYDYYNPSIQTFLVTQVYTGEYFTDNSGDVGTAFDLVITAITSLLPFLSFYIFPNITIASLLLVPLVFSLVLFIFKLFKR